MFFRWLDNLEEWLIAALLGLMTVITFGQVVARYVFNYSFTWALELVTYLFGALIFLGMAYGVRVGAHIGVDALVKTLRPMAVRVVGGVAALLCLVYSLIGLYGSVLYIEKMRDIGILAQDLPIEQWIPRCVLAIGFAVMAARFAIVIYRIVVGTQPGLRLSDEAEEALKLKADNDQGAPGTPAP